MIIPKAINWYANDIKWKFVKLSNEKVGKKWEKKKKKEKIEKK